MIKTEQLGPTTLKIIVPAKLSLPDFKTLEPTLDHMIAQHDKIRLLIDATHLSGWDNISSFEKHVGLVKNHQLRVERIAVIIGHDWQHWIAVLADAFLAPEIKTFASGEETLALNWLNTPPAPPHASHGKHLQPGAREPG